MILQTSVIFILVLLQNQVYPYPLQIVTAPLSGLFVLRVLSSSVSLAWWNTLTLFVWGRGDRGSKFLPTGDAGLWWASFLHRWPAGKPQHCLLLPQVNSKSVSLPLKDYLAVTLTSFIKIFYSLVIERGCFLLNRMELTKINLQSK